MDSFGGDFYFIIWDVVYIIISILPYLFFTRIVRKAGFSAWWILPSLIPIVGLVLLWVFAFSKWPSYPEQ